jgi:hypothetical protein
MLRHGMASVARLSLLTVFALCAVILCRPISTSRPIANRVSLTVTNCLATVSISVWFWWNGHYKGETVVQPGDSVRFDGPLCMDAGPCYRLCRQENQRGQNVSIF